MLEHFIERKPLISEEWERGTDNKGIEQGLFKTCVQIFSIRPNSSFGMVIGSDPMSIQKKVYLHHQILSEHTFFLDKLYAYLHK